MLISDLAFIGSDFHFLVLVAIFVSVESVVDLCWLVGTASKYLLGKVTWKFQVEIISVPGTDRKDLRWARGRWSENIYRKECLP